PPTTLSRGRAPRHPLPLVGRSHRTWHDLATGRPGERRGTLAPGVARYARCLPQCQKEMARRMGIRRDDSLRGSDHLNKIASVETAKKEYVMVLRLPGGAGFPTHGADVASLTKGRPRNPS